MKKLVLALGLFCAPLGAAAEVGSAVLRDVVDHHQVIDQLAQPHPAGVGADGLAELPGHQQHRDDLVDAGKTAGVDLHVVDRVGLQQLLEQQLDAAQQVGDAQEVARLTRRSNSVMLGKAPRQNNKIDVLSSTSINDRLQKLADSLGLDIKLASHRFRRT